MQLKWLIFLMFIPNISYDTLHNNNCFRSHEKKWGRLSRQTCGRDEASKSQLATSTVPTTPTRPDKNGSRSPRPDDGTSRTVLPSTRSPFALSYCSWVILQKILEMYNFLLNSLDWQWLTFSFLSMPCASAFTLIIIMYLYTVEGYTFWHDY